MKNWTRSVVLAAVSLSSVLPVFAAPPVATADPADTGRLCTLTSIRFFGDTTLLVDGYGDRVQFRKNGIGPWHTAMLGLDNPHTAARLAGGDWLVVDTDHHRVIEFKDFDGGERLIRNALAGRTLNRPHDVVVGPDGYAYVIDGNRNLFRFRDLNSPVEVWPFSPAEMGYARALSWFDGKLHIIHSSRGEVLRIDDFATHRYTRFASPRPKPDDHPAGALSTTGLVLNDVEHYRGWYYGTSYFTRSWAMGADPHPGRLVRWLSWADFTAGKWQDLGDLIPDPLVPYYMDVHDGALYIAAFNHESRCEGDRVIKLTAPD
jgi:hypothetical protein